MSPSKPTPDGGVSARALGASLGVSRDTVLRWVERGLLPPVTFRGGATSYGASHQLRARVIVKLRDRGVAYDAMPPLLATTDADLVARYEPPAAPPASPAAPPSFSLDAPAWQRVELIPGLELHVAVGAGELVRRLAAEVVDRYRA